MLQGSSIVRSAASSRVLATLAIAVAAVSFHDAALAQSRAAALGLFRPSIAQFLIDGDFDGRGDPCDCAPADPGAFGQPTEVAGIVVGADKETISWTAMEAQTGPTLYHDIVRGLVPALPVDGGAGESCLVSGVLGQSFADEDPLAPGQTYWYVVRARNTCATGTYGFATGGIERTPPPCP